jgi:hypothetical protein
VKVVFAVRCGYETRFFKEIFEKFGTDEFASVVELWTEYECVGIVNIRNVD